MLGAEKNFNKFAERMEDEGEPVVDQNYFKHAVAKAILWRTTEKVFDNLDLDGYRANSVAYTVGWLSEQSAHRIDLDRIWYEQRVSQTLCDAIKIVCTAAHNHITSQEGNPGEASKHDACWKAFQTAELFEPPAWRNELANSAFIPANTVEEALALEWERVRTGFINDSRTIGELEALTGKVWMRTRRGDQIYFYAEKTWEQLRAERLRGNQRLGIASLRGLVELVSAAAS